VLRHLPDPDVDPVEVLLVRGRTVHRFDDRGRAIEVTGKERELLLGEAAAARAVRAWERWRAREPG
jgi:hypothetical protein